MTVKQALAELEPAKRERIQVIFISANPDRDTPEVLSPYLAAFDPKFIDLIDDFKTIQAVMKPFSVFAKKKR